MSGRWNEARTRAQSRRALLNWFADHARDLPWRRDPTPYKVWVSEIMCQQTQIATVVPYFERFIDQYPDIASLAGADEAELMRRWEGLGYYRRARSLHAAAQQIMAEHEGVFPLVFEQVLALPGIGRYTAGAILSISSNLRFPVLEGNTQRVFSRLLALRSPPSETESQQTLWQFAESWLPRARTTALPDRTHNTAEKRARGPAAFNQAAMELGALICTPQEPKCLVCPISRWCDTRELGLQARIPAKSKQTQYEARNEFAVLVRQQTRQGEPQWLVGQLPEGKRFAGMWDFPKAGPPEVNDINSMERWLSEQLGGNFALGRQTHQFKHAVTKYRITLQVFEATWAPSKGKSLPKQWRFQTVHQLAALPMSTTGRKLVRKLASG